MYLAGHRVVPSRGRIKQRRRTSTLWLRAMLRRDTLGLPHIYLHLHLHSHPLAISNGPAQNQQQQSSGGQSMLYVFFVYLWTIIRRVALPKQFDLQGPVR